MGNRSKFQCSQFCFDRALSCLKLARLNLPTQRSMFIRMAANWKDYAMRCGGRPDVPILWCEKKPKPTAD
jgi:hypothetical protein